MDSLTIRDRSLATAARPRKNAMAGARGYRSYTGHEQKWFPSDPRAPPNQPKSIRIITCAASTSKHWFVPKFLRKSKINNGKLRQMERIQKPEVSSGKNQTEHGKSRGDQKGRRVGSRTAFAAASTAGLAGGGSHHHPLRRLRLTLDGFLDQLFATSAAAHVASGAGGEQAAWKSGGHRLDFFCLGIESWIGISRLRWKVSSAEFSSASLKC